jgi:hypothetical protein
MWCSHPSGGTTPATPSPKVRKSPVSRKTTTALVTVPDCPSGWLSGRRLPALGQVKHACPSAAKEKALPLWNVGKLMFETVGTISPTAKPERTCALFLMAAAACEGAVDGAAADKAAAGSCTGSCVVKALAAFRPTLPVSCPLFIAPLWPASPRPPTTTSSAAWT